MSEGRSIISLVAERQEPNQFRKKNWSGSFEAYLDYVRSDPKITRNAFERVYDMIMSYGTEVVEKYREKHVRYRFFSDPDQGGQDAVFGLDDTLAALVNAFKSRRRLRHRKARFAFAWAGRQQQEHHCPADQERPRAIFGPRQRHLFTLGWVDLADSNNVHWCPMHEEPLHLFRIDSATTLAKLNSGLRRSFQVRINGELCPFCRYIYSER